MTNEEAKKMLEAKLKCLIAETSGTNHDCNMRLCDGCSLNYEQGNMGEQKQALDMAIKALEQQPSEPRTNLAETSQDCISIEPIQWYSQNKDGYLVKGAYSKDEAYVKLTDVYEKIRISEDCISREEVQDLISRWLSDYLLDETREALETINYKVGDMPSVYPERPKGKWLHIYKSDIACECSVCHIQMPITEYFHYCPNCGANMFGGGENEDRKSL